MSHVLTLYTEKIQKNNEAFQKNAKVIFICMAKSSKDRNFLLFVHFEIYFDVA